MKNLLLIILLFICLMPAKGASLPDSIKQARTPSAWTLIEPLGLHQPAEFDTLPYNYQRQAIPSLQSDAFATTGNLGAPGINEIFMQRPQLPSFFFNAGMLHWLPQQQKFYNVYVPFTQLSYNTGGNKQNTQDRLRMDFAGNVNRRVGIGARLDYLYSKGMYQDQSTKDFTFGLSGYYRGDRYQMQAFYDHYNLLNKENGGITDARYITDPAVLQGGVDKIEARAIPVNLTAAHSRLSGQRLMLNQCYNVGYWREQAVNDTLTREVYVPVTRFIWTMNLITEKHKFINNNAKEAESFWSDSFFNNSLTHDSSYHSEFTNTLGISMVEGFRNWAKFGLAVYGMLNLHHYRTETLLPDGSYGSTPPQLSDDSGYQLGALPEGFIAVPVKNQQFFSVGAQLTKQKGSLITYEADAKIGLIGVAGDIELRGKAQSRFKLLGDTVNIAAHAEFSNLSQDFLLNHFVSNHFAWDNDFGSTRRLRLGGELLIPWTKTHLSADFENVQNYVYFGPAGLPMQEGGSTQIFAARLDQRINAGILHWDNQITYQTSSRSDVIPLPKIVVYSNLYLNFWAFKVLLVQLGVDCDWYSRYYAPAYQPATMTFCTQQSTKIGNYPFMNAYATFKLKKVRFYAMLSHVNQNLFSRDAFSMPLYPLNPRRFQIGLSVDFAN